MAENQNRFDELYRIIDTVVQCRYRAQKRLNYHNWLSQITLTGLAIGLIVIPLLVLGGFNRNFQAKYVDVMQIVFAVGILGYSLLLSLGNFAVRAERMHASGLKLSRMLRLMLPLKGRDDDETNKLYAGLVTEYYDILEGNENHIALDYQGTLSDIMRKQGLPKAEPSETSWNRQIVIGKYLIRRTELRLTIMAHCLLLFGHYFLSLLAVAIWGVLMCIKH